MVSRRKNAAANESDGASAVVRRLTPLSETRMQILNAASGCFARYGVNKTSLEDVAEAAGVSRQTLYRHFKGKTDLLDQLCCVEAEKINAEVRGKIGKQRRFEDLLTECLFQIIKIVSQHPFMKSVLDDVAFQSKAAHRESSIHQLNRSWWIAILTRAAESGELAKDLNHDEVVSWMTMAQASLQIRISNGDVSDAELKRIIRRFVVWPLLARRPGDAG